MFQLRDPQRAALAKDAAARALVETFSENGASAFYDSERSYVCVVGRRQERSYFGLDDAGRIVQTLSPMGRRTAFQFSGEKLVASTSSRGAVVRFSYAEDDRQVRIERDNGASEQFLLDTRGELVRYTLADGSSLDITRGPHGATQIRDRAGAVIRRQYDDFGALSSITDGLGRTVVLESKADSATDHVTYPDGTSETYEYDGTLIKHAVGGAPHAVYLTSSEGKLVGAQYADGQAFELVYGAHGKVVSAISGDAVVLCEYDAKGRPVRESQDGREVRYTYDDDGLLESLTLPDGQTSKYSYDLDGRLESVTDWAGGVQRFAYGPAAMPTSRELPNRLKEQYSADTLGRPLGIELTSEGRVLWRQGYEHDAMDRVTHLRDSRGRARRYEYDRAGHLLTALDEGGNAVEQFAYDLNENRTHTLSGAAVSDLRDQILNDGHFSFRHDALGNRRERSSVYGVTKYEYGRHNLLLMVTRSDGSVVKFGYDAFGRRVSKETDELRVRYVWAGNVVVQELHEAAGKTWTREFLFVPGTYQPLALQDRDGIAFFHCDRIGTPQLLTNAEGQVVWSANYDSYGHATLVGAEVEQPLRFSGQYYDAETGLHYNRARYYDPQLGRYLSRDPVAPVGGVNPYLYAGGNPVNQTDPLGLWGESWPGWVKTSVAIAGAVVAGAAVAAAVIVAAPLIGVAAGTAGVIALVAGGLAAGAAGGGLDAAMTEGGCVPCAMLRGAELGLFGSLLFLLAPELELGIAGVAAVGAVVSGATYLFDVATSERKFSAADLGISMAIGAALAPIGQWLGGVFVRGMGGGRPGTVAYRGDDRPYSPAGRKPGSTKSHINPDGEIQPANPNGAATVAEHVRGAEPMKSDSPYTSFKEDPATGKAFGDQETQVDVTRLQNDIASGKVKNVEVLDHDQLMQVHDQNVADMQKQYDADPSPKNEKALAKAQEIREFSARDTEMLIKGTVPSEYVTEPGAKPLDSAPPIPALPLPEDDQ